MLSYQQLSTPVSETEAKTIIITRLTELGFSATSWQSGSVQLTFVMLLAWFYARLTEFVATLVAACFLETSQGEFLTRYSKSVYQNIRKPSIAAQHRVRLNVASGSGPYTINVGDSVATDGTRTYRNVTSGTVNTAQNDTSANDLTYEAEVAGAAGNAAADTITKLVTTLAGVTITNPDAAPSRAGADEETDAELAERNQLKWGELAVEMPGAGYKSVALSVTGIRRCDLDDTNPDGPGTLRVYVAGSNVAADPGAKAEAGLLLQSRRSVCAIVTLPEPPSQTVAVAGVVYITQSKLSAAQATVTTNLTDYIQRLPLGGAQLTSIFKGVPLDGIEETIRAVDGVQNVDLTTPTSDVAVPAFGLCVADLSGLVFTGI
jgi:uncharacterized phage protein gp47/JayE